MEAISSFSGSLEVKPKTFCSQSISPFSFKAMNAGMSTVNTDYGKAPRIHETTFSLDGSYSDEDVSLDGDYPDGSDIDAFEDDDDNLLFFEDKFDKKYYLLLKAKHFLERVIKTSATKSGQVIELSNSGSEYKGKQFAGSKKKRKSKPLK
ncbi:hypothetical protein BOTCAL_0875g00010 [Botryotinia calthae]|uniref:Uncharacterized protein n=1 Tax=Botryotinia calthae TaxID=38488 RepID=A0A4Y8CHW1_9HELO|nr:hypothetical protein BOTCAL_0875g00010 [Botryotinia calthae]